MKIRALVDNRSARIQAYLHWRVINPFRYIDGYDNHTAKPIWPDVGTKLESWVDILVLPRIVVGTIDQSQVSHWFKAIKARGTKLVYECDDDIFSPDYVSQLVKVLHDKSKGPQGLVATLDILEARRRDALWTLQQCDAAIAASEPLTEYVKTLVPEKPVYHVPNYIDSDTFVKGLREHKVITNPNLVSIGWAGGNRDPADLDEMINAWIQIARQNDNVRFVINGWLPPQIKDNPFLLERTTHLKWSALDLYAHGYQVDIGCCAVLDTPFNERKTTIKAWEYGLAGTPVVASEALYGREGFVLAVKGVDDWVCILQHLIDNPENRHQMAQLLKGYVECQYQLKYGFHNWLNVYKDIVGSDSGSKRLTKKEAAIGAS